LAGMAKSPIKHSLETIWIGKCGVYKEQVREMVDRHGFTNIKEIIIGNSEFSDSEDSF
jgi:hypothetical protein